MSVTTFYPNASDATINDNDPSWDTCIAGGGNMQLVEVGGVKTAPGLYEVNAGTGHNMRKSFECFDTSAIGTDVVSATIFKVTPESFGSCDIQTAWNVVNSNQANPALLAKTDWLLHDTTRFLDTDVEYGNDMTAGTEYSATFNSAGRSNVNTSGYTKLVIMDAEVLDDNEQVGMNGWNYFFYYTSEESGTTKDPKLVVTHSVAIPSFTGDATIMTAHSNTFSGDSNLLRVNDNTFTGDANLAETVTPVTPGTIVYEGCDTKNSFNPGVSSKSYSFTVADKPDSILCAFFYGESVSALSISCTYDGDSFTEVASRYWNSDRGAAAMFILVNPSTGSNTMAWETGSDANGNYILAQFSGVNTDDPIGLGEVNSGLSKTFTTSMDGTMTCEFPNSKTLAVVPLSGQTKPCNIGINNYYSAIGYEAIASAGSTTQSWNWVISGNYLGIMELLPAMFPGFTGDAYLTYTYSDTFTGDASLASTKESTFTGNSNLAEYHGPVNTRSMSLVRASSQYLSRANTASLSITSDFTFISWIKLTAVPPSNGFTYGLMSSGQTAGQYAIIIQFRNDGGQQKVRLYNSNNGTNLGLADVNWTISADTWYHVAVEYDASAGQLEVYQNGSSVGTATGTLYTSIHDTTGEFRIGQFLGTGFYDGKVDEIGFYNALVGSDFILSDYKSGRGTCRSSSEANIIAGYRFEDTLLDVTANNNDLTNHSGTYSPDVPFVGTVVTDATFTGDATIVNVFETNFTGDAYIVHRYSNTFTSDASLRSEVSETYSGDSNLVKVVSSTMRGDATLTRTVYGQITGDSKILRNISETFSSDASLIISSVQFTGDATLIPPSIGLTYKGDANLVRSNITQNFTGDTNLIAVINSSYTGNSNLKTVVSGQMTADSNLRLADISNSISGDSNIVAAIHSSYTGNASLVVNVKRFFSGDASLLSVEEGSFNSNTNLVGVIANIFTGNAEFAEIISGEFTGDSSILKSNITNTFTGDVLLEAEKGAGFAGSIIASATVTSGVAGVVTLDNKRQLLGFGLARTLQYPLKINR